MITSSGVVGRNRPNAQSSADASSAFQISTRRKPSRFNVRAASVFMKIAPIAETNVRRPDCTGLKPKPSCSISGSRNGVAPMPMRNSEPPTTPARYVANRNSVEVEQRVLVPTLVHDVADERGAAENERRDGNLDRHQVLAERREAEHRGAEPAAREREAEPVERRRRLARRRNEAQRERDAERADRQVDEEDPAPIEVCRDEAAERRADHRPHERRDREPRQRLHELGLRHGAQQHEPADGHHHRAAGALQEAAATSAPSESLSAHSRSSPAGTRRSRRRTSRGRRSGPRPSH